MSSTAAAGSPPKAQQSVTAPPTAAATATTAAATSNQNDGSYEIPQERIAEMRRAIHEHLQKSSVFDDIRNIIDIYSADHPNFDPNNSDEVMRLIRERGVVQDLLSRLQQTPTVSTGSQPIGGGSSTKRLSAIQGMKPGSRYLHVRVLQGRAFLDHLDMDMTFQKTHQVIVAMHYGNQRFRCVPQPCTVDPLFDDDFLIQLDATSAGGTDLLEIATPLQIAVIREDCAFGRSAVIGENTIEWRRVLKTGFLSLSVELCGENPGVPAGIVELQLELIPGGPRRTEDEIACKVDIQRAAIVAADREFLIYARRWWAEFQAMRPTHGDRKVKVFAASSTGRMIPVTHFVTPVLPDRVLDSPFAAARFVSLFALNKDEDLTNEVLSGGNIAGGNGAASRGLNGTDNWMAPFLFLSQRRGDICHHATLLCSLLLGFGLDAYCAVGTTTAGNAAHMFVVTRRKLGNRGDFEVTYWDPASGERFSQTGAHTLVTVGCLFNDRQYYANVQPSDNAITSSFDLENDQMWKAIHPLKLRMVPKLPAPPLMWIPLNTRLMEVELEAALQTLVGAHRDGLGLPTKWDSELSFVLAQALTAYEQQRLNNTSSADLGMFQACVKGKIGDGKTFKGVPLNVAHVSERKILSAWLASASGKELLSLVGDDMKFALRVKCTAFPEGVVSTWIMVAASYRIPLS